MLQRAPQPEAMVRVRCAQCGHVYVFIGKRADALLYQLFFSTIVLGAEIEAHCDHCQHCRAFIEDGAYVIPTLVA
jgi:hypothetical protein